MMQYFNIYKILIYLFTQPEKQANGQATRLNVSLDIYEIEFYFRLPFGFLNDLLAKHCLCLEPQAVLCAKKPWRLLFAL